MVDEPVSERLDTEEKTGPRGRERLQVSLAAAPDQVLSELELDLSYESSAGQLVDSFYVPCLTRSVRYDRAVGYFRSSVFVLVGLAMSEFALRGGTVRLVSSPYLSTEDVNALEEGADARERLDEALLRELEELLANPDNVPTVRLLATLVGAGALDIRLSYPRLERGLFHDKLGIFSDASGNSVSFRGSNNETLSAWDADANHESFETFCSWDQGSDAERVQRHRRYFDYLWEGQLQNLVVVEMGERALTLLRTHSHPDGVRGALEDVRGMVVGQERPRLGPTVTLQEHQAAVVRNWFAAGCRGLIDHVTGAGKTISALEITREWLRRGGPTVVVVPSLLLARQWAREIGRLLVEHEVALLRADSEGGQWRAAVRDFTAPVSDFGSRITIVTLDTGSSDAFLTRVEGGNHLLLIADEVHRIGAPGYRRILEVEAGGRLGLSATPQRFGDPIGTAAIFDYFGDVLPPPFTIGDGIRAGRLVPYDYRVFLTEMTDIEWEEWIELSDEIAPLVARQRDASDPDPQLGERLQRLYIQRARLKKQASNKPDRAAEILEEYFGEGDRWLVYCDDQLQLRAVIEALAERGIEADEYHSAMLGARDETLAHFERNGGVLAAIRCLDEGVDIPAIDRALIIASSVNRREFIQRRGRVLRTSPATGKFSAAIHDTLVTAPGGRVSGSVLPTELQRATEFAATARNSAVRMQLARLRALADVATGGDDVEDAPQDEPSSNG